MKRLLAALTLVACSLAMAASAPPKKPRLILMVVVDQFRYDYLLRFSGDYTAGLKRMWTEGAVFDDAHYVHVPTVTAVGHSTVLTGATPLVSGIIGNEWYERQTASQVTSVSDPSTTLVGAAGAAGSSPHRLLVSTVGDEIKSVHADTRIIGISIKDRSAILPAGHMADGAYWFDNDSGHWVSSTFYMKELPKWVEAVNDSKPAARSVGQVWRALNSKTSDAPLCTMVKDTPNMRYCGSLEASPWGNEMIEELAEKALGAENLGRHSSTDILAVSFSSNDYVGHAVGPDAPEVRDISRRTDILLGKLIAAAERQAGLGNVITVLTADHGVASVPETARKNKMPGGRIDARALTATIEKALADRFGEGKWVLGNSDTSPYLNRELIAKYKTTEAQAENVAAAAVRALPHVYRVYTATQLASGQISPDSISTAVNNGYYRARAGNLVILFEPGYLTGNNGTTHGTPFGYDTHVPVLFLGSGIKPGHYYQKIAVNDIAPTLAAIVGVAQPTGSVGRVLQEMWQ